MAAVVAFSAYRRGKKNRVYFGKWEMERSTTVEKPLYRSRQGAVPSYDQRRETGLKQQKGGGGRGRKRKRGRGRKSRRRMGWDGKGRDGRELCVEDGGLCDGVGVF
jgi:hypothetical protein